ncbi:hypothetical protein D3C78_1800760 [compost metagenome]
MLPSSSGSAEPATTADTVPSVPMLIPVAFSGMVIWGIRGKPAELTNMPSLLMWNWPSRV